MRVTDPEQNDSELVKCQLTQDYSLSYNYNENSSRTVGGRGSSLRSEIQGSTDRGLRSQKQPLVGL